MCFVRGTEVVGDIDRQRGSIACRLFVILVLVGVYL